MSDTIPAPASLHLAIPLQVSIAAGSPLGITELEVVYDGTTPPIELFEALVAAGWSQPVATPPPRSAIDWGTPDPATGTPYTIAPYRAVTRVVPPAGQGGTELVDAAMVVALAHGAEVPDQHRADARRSLAAAVAHLAAPPPAAAPRALEVPPEGGPGDTIVSAVISPARVEGAVAMFGPSVVVLERAPTIIITTNTYRGRTCESQSPAVRLSVCVPAAGLDEVTSILAQVAASTPEVHTSAG